VSGPDLTFRLCEMAARQGIRVGFFGSTPEVIDALSRNLALQFPELKLSFCYSPPFRALDDEEDEEVVQKITKAGVEILFVGLGCPKQEHWIAQHRGRIFATMLGVGYAFDVLAGTSKRAPLWIQNIGMEWCFRLILNPRKLWRRYAINNLCFPILLGKQLCQRKLTPRLVRRRVTDE
jgi:N-acetylglucosaminyldiphosphoundecaprenol N-acetyl-beta-D-mannosaminyltransferase